MALKRVIITIPAKSYVARIDADKRQIETAVAGVSLYTVASVTNSEVVLTSALNVIAAEMPYLIYNDNDEEKTFSIVVSTGDADDVTVAAEFQGTLVAQEMPGSGNGTDYYVLNGKNFVWVKDAGTIGAHKCWLAISSNGAAPVRSLNFVFEDGDATGISSIDNGQWTIDNEGIYDLSGRRVAKPTKGLYIVNGKKIAVK